VILATGYADLPEGLDPDIVRLSKPFLQEDLARAVAASVGLVEQNGIVVPFRPKSG